MLKAPRGIWKNPPTSCSRRVRRGLLICDDCQALTGGFRAPVGCARLCRGGNIMIRTATALIAVLSATAAHCQAQPAPLAPAARAATVQEPSAYCRSGAAILFQGSGDAELAAVQQGCRRGDIIAISAAAQGSVFQIGRLCDFSKAIVNAGGQIVSVLTGTRGIR
jgi:hypothetical protein